MPYTRTSFIDAPMRHSFTMDRYSGSGRTNSTVDDSPFGSTLNTPLDEDLREPFEAIGQKLREIQTQRAPDKTDLEEQYVTSEATSQQSVAGIDEDPSFISPSRQEHLQEAINRMHQPQVEIQQNSIQEANTSSFSTNISHAVDEENVERSFINVSDTSAISERLLSSFPPVPFSSPEVTNDQNMSTCPVSFSTELSRSLYNIQSQSNETSPAPSLSIQNSINPADSPMFFSPALDQGFHAHSRTLASTSLYNLPNAPINIYPSMANAESECSYYSEVEGITHLAVQASVIPPQGQADNLIDLQDHLVLSSEPEYTFSVLRSLDLSLANLPVLFFKLSCFIPWCALVGGTILIFPANIAKVAFSPGIGVGNLRLDYVSPPPKNIHRFAHWAECAIPHIMTFLGALITGLWCLTGTRTGLGLVITVIAVVLAQMVIAWQDFDFRLGRSGRPAGRLLGEDDRESIWMVIRLYVMAEDSKTWFTGSLEKGLFVVDQVAQTD